MEEKDLSTFDICVHGLFDTCKELMNLSEKRKLKLDNRKNGILEHLKKYINIYGKTQPEEHTDYFLKVFERNKKAILLGPQRDNWLLEGSVSITFGGEENIKSNYIIHLSSIYVTAIRIRDEIIEELNGFPDTKNSTEVLYPFKIMLSLYKIFHELIESPNDKNKIKTHISYLEEKIGVKKQSSNVGGMSELLDMAAGAAEKLTGTKIPRDKIPQASELQDLFGGLANDPKAKNMLGGFMEKIQKGEGLGEIVNTVLGGLGSIAADKTAPASSNNNNNLLPPSEGSNVNDEFDNM